MSDFSCTCEECQDACRHKPGWFLPHQVDDLLKYFKVDDIDVLIGDKLAIDWYCQSEDILVLSPQIKSNVGSIQFPGNPKGECVFFKDGRCEIYKVRPFECRELNHNEPDISGRHSGVADAWEKSTILSGYKDKVVSESFTIFDDILGGLFK